MHAGGHTYGEIAKTLRIARSYAYKLVNDSTEPSPAKTTNVEWEGFIQEYLSSQ